MLFRSNLSGYVIGNIESIPQIGFDLISLPDNYVDLDIFSSIIPVLKNKPCLFVYNEEIPIITDQDYDCICGSYEPTLKELTFSISNLQNRADAYRLIEENVLNKHHKLLSGQWIYGTYDFWTGFVGFQTLLMENKYLDRFYNYYDIMLNLFVANFNQKVLVK